MFQLKLIFCKVYQFVISPFSAYQASDCQIRDFCTAGYVLVSLFDFLEFCSHISFDPFPNLSSLYYLLL